MAEFRIAGVHRAAASLGRPIPRHPNSVAYAKWVVVQRGDVWYIKVGAWFGYHATLVAEVLEEYNLSGPGLAEYEGRIEQRGGPGTEITVTLPQEGQVPDEVPDLIRRSLLEAQRQGEVR